MFCDTAPARNDPLDDIYGSTPSSPTLLPKNHDSSCGRDHEILSDLPSRRRALDTDAYREGLSSSKGQFVQEGFDEGYSLGANLGQRVGYILGLLQGFVTALEGNDERHGVANELWQSARKELVIQELLGQVWVDEEGIWKWKVKGEEEEVTFREVAGQHPVVRRWLDRVRQTSQEWAIDLDALESNGHVEVEKQS